MKKLIILFMMSVTLNAVSQNTSFAELVKQRQSVRNYEDTPVEKDKLIQCIESARLSPSANNAQPWRFIVVDDPAIKQKVASAASGMGMNKHTKQAPVIVAVVLEKRDMISSIAASVQDKETDIDVQHI